MCSMIHGNPRSPENVILLCRVPPITDCTCEPVVVGLAIRRRNLVDKTVLRRDGKYDHPSIVNRRPSLGWLVTHIGSRTLFLTSCPTDAVIMVPLVRPSMFDQIKLSAGGWVYR